MENVMLLKNETITKATLVESCEIKRKACNVWNVYKSEVFDDTTKFDDFLREVFVGKYHDDACITKLLLEYHMNLAELYVKEAFARLKNNNNGIGFKKGKSDLSQKAFLVCIAARSINPDNFDSSSKGKDLTEMYMNMFNESKDEKLEKRLISNQTREKLKKLGCTIDVGIVAQMSQAYIYARKNCHLLSSYVWFFFYKNKLVYRRNPMK
ncbi:hypothetical protein BCR32DRAFT_281334 [Anaeromyces robustus]|uniref:Uncharacterized protein n=1 Tax=Anaeromyces robustus TaxID=1754192 RepID=A0A1Y1X111_9FUNG|nr:hypothetical protein BCR32DRAFT_281334 [Anaeromyces robustus]|eukprot:ORX79490.1 hypothetical protein BCR32DRAFT_281334 [Anaeromyces robustus]